MIVKMLEDTKLNSRVYMAGEKYDFDKDTAEKLIAAGAALNFEAVQKKPLTVDVIVKAKKK